MITEIFELVREADRVVDGVIRRTPLDHSRALSEATGGRVYLKLENLQRTGAFKIRGAYYALWKAIKEKKISKCVAASSGNHAQGVALAASELGVEATIVMPVHAPLTKVKATINYGANVVLHGETYDDAYRKAVEIATEQGAEFVHPFNDPAVIAGQGTIGLELVRQLPDLDALVVPVGGGGLISGVAIAVKKFRPQAMIYGVQPRGSPAMALSFKKGRLVEVKNVDTIADGVAVKKPGDLTLSIIRELVDDMVLVDEDYIVRAVFTLLERSKCVAEPAGALGVAALLSGKLDVKKKKTAIVVSGGNVDMSMLARIVERGLVLEGRQVRIRGVLPDRPGSLSKVLAMLASAKANIVTIEHDRVNPRLNPGKAEVIITLEVPEPQRLGDIIKQLGEKGFRFETI